MVTLLRGHISNAAAPFIFLAVFLFIGGAALWITPRLAAWLDKKAAQNKGYYDGMLTEDPNAPRLEEEDEGEKAPKEKKEGGAGSAAQ